MIGERIRHARQARRLSLANVAEQANISVATLSRIETNKQALELGLFLLLARVLSISPHELLGEGDGGEKEASSGIDPIIAQIALLDAPDRLRMWRELAATHRARRNQRHPAVRDIALEVDELLAQIDFFREEVENVRAIVKKRR